ncbi:MAG: hypothetical protein ACP5KY_08850 [Thermoproteus sp.]
MSEEVRPIFARAFFNMDPLGSVSQYMVFYYRDPKAYYAGLSREALRRELEAVRRNMQSFLDEEAISINGRRVEAKVVHVDIGLIAIDLPYITFLIKFRGELRRGLNVYEDVYEEEVAEYPYEFLWSLPGRVVRAAMAGDVRIHGSLLSVRVPAGTKVGGRESIEFYID